MRKLIASSLVLALSLFFAPATALAAQTSQTITATFATVQFSSILGGTVSGTGVVEGTVANDALGSLRGVANLPLRDQKLTIEPIGLLARAQEQLQVSWYRYQCDPYWCNYESGISTFERSFAQGPVDIRLGTMRGNGTLTFASDATCVGACAPAGASYSYVPMGWISVNGAVLGAQDAGNVFMSGPAPVIR